MFFHLNHAVTEETAADLLNALASNAIIKRGVSPVVFSALLRLREVANASRNAIKRKEQEKKQEEKTLKIECSAFSSSALEFEADDDGDLRIDHSDGDAIITDKEGAKKIIKFLQEYVGDKRSENSDALPPLGDFTAKCEFSTDFLRTSTLPFSGRPILTINSRGTELNIIPNKEKLTSLRDHLSEMIKRL